MPFPFLPGTNPGGCWKSSFTRSARPAGGVFFVGLNLSSSVSWRVTSALAYYFYLRNVLRQLNPSKVIPTRVRDALDSLAEGLVVMDHQERVVLVNRAFEQASGRSLTQLLGRSLSELEFVSREEQSNHLYPWQETLARDRHVHGRLFGLHSGTPHTRTFSVSSAPIFDEQGNNRGAMASFEDVSKLESNRQELRLLVEQLRASGEEIKKQNQQLVVLATRDPLTGCFNRRSFLERFDTHWQTAQRYGHPLTAMMVDVDHFKSVNDNFGHNVGDEVLQRVAAELCETARSSDVVCRFGGEEFAILLPQTDLDAGELAAEKFRVAIERLHFPQLSVTVSVGVSSLSELPTDPQDLLHQADKCLYVAKRSGRNQVVRWDQVPAELEEHASKVSQVVDQEAGEEGTSIPYHAVTALISALAYRDQETAAHSRRVADLCVATVEGLLSLKDCYTLEIAALLHDIGKIGVPDSILLKSGTLTPSEWAVMQGHDRIGLEIIRASFQSTSLSAIVENHHAFFGGNAEKPNQLSGRAIPIGARVLAIADAFDSMVSDRVYRKGRSRREAIEELRRCAGTQFDPDVVERFAHMIDVRSDPAALPINQVSTEAALSIGVQLERLVAVIDNQDVDEIRALSRRLSMTATKYGALTIADKAAELGTNLDTESGLLGVMMTANELLDLCRGTQSCFLLHGDGASQIGQVGRQQTDGNRRESSDAAPSTRRQGNRLAQRNVVSDRHPPELCRPPFRIRIHTSLLDYETAWVQTRKDSS